MDGLITLEELQQSLFDSSRFDVGLAEWVISIVSDTARHVAAKPEWTAENIPPAAQSVVKLVPDGTRYGFPWYGGWA